MNKQLQSEDFLYCYTKKLSDFLQSEGFNYIVKAKGVKDDKLFTLYQKSDELQKAIDKYKEINKK